MYPTGGLFENPDIREEVSNITSTHDYLAIIPIGAGSSWGRSSDKEVAIKNAITALKDWQVYYELSNVEIIVNVIDVQGYGQCLWGSYPDGYIRGTNEATGVEEPIKRTFDKVKRTTPKWKRKK